jgi:hypothetical protein
MRCLALEQFNYMDWQPPNLPVCSAKYIRLLLDNHDLLIKGSVDTCARLGGTTRR